MSIFEKAEAGVEPDVEMMVASMTRPSVLRAFRISAKISIAQTSGRIIGSMDRWISVIAVKDCILSFLRKFDRSKYLRLSFSVDSQRDEAVCFQLHNERRRSSEIVLE